MTNALAVARRSRLKERACLPGEISDARLDDFPMLDRAYEPPTELEPQHFFAVKTARTSEAVIVATLQMLAQRQTRSF